MARGASAAAMPMRKKPASMKNANPTMLLNLFRFSGRAWSCAMMAWMFFGSVTVLPGSGAEGVFHAVSVAAFVVWAVLGLVLLAAWIAARQAEPTGDLAIIREAMSRWLAAIGGGLIGGVVAAVVANAFFIQIERAGSFVLACLVGLLAGPVALLLHRRPATTALAAIPPGLLLAACFLNLLGFA